MSKEFFPEIKKNLKSFILKEDAKLIDKSASKVAIISAFTAASFLLNIDNAHAKGHRDHSEHSNGVAYEGTDPRLGNDLNKSVTVHVDDKIPDVTVEPKTATAVHGNHYNYANGSGKSGDGL